MTYKPNPFAGGDLASYVQTELKKISDDLANAQGAASLFVTAPMAPIAATTTYQKIAGFTNRTPQRDYRGVQPGALPGGELYVRRPGQVGVSFTITAAVPAAAGYRVSLFVNDVVTALEAIIDPSNQTTVATMAALGTLRVAGALDRVADKFDLRVQTIAGAGNFTVQRAYFSVWWLGD